MRIGNYQGGLAVVCGLVVAFGGLGLAQGNTSVGTWTLNVAESTFSPGPPPKSQTPTILAFALGVTTTVDVVAADGSTQHWTYTAGYDDRNVRITGNNPNGDMAARKRLSPSTTVTTIKRMGKATTVNTGVVSPDGKTYTVTVKGTDPQGRAVNNVLVFDKRSCRPLIESE